MSNPYGPGFQALRPEVLARNDGLCQYCGIEQSAEVHHAMKVYPGHDEVRADQLTALCRPCHEFITSVRKWKWFGQSVGALLGYFRNQMNTREFLVMVREADRMTFLAAVSVEQPKGKLGSIERGEPVAAVRTEVPRGRLGSVTREVWTLE